MSDAESYEGGALLDPHSLSDNEDDYESTNNKQEEEGDSSNSTISKLKSLNAALLKELSEKESEIERLQISAGGGSITAADFKESKIIELAKKNRNLNLKYQNEKTKTSRLTSEVNSLRAVISFYHLHHQLRLNLPSLSLSPMFQAEKKL